MLHFGLRFSVFVNLETLKKIDSFVFGWRVDDLHFLFSTELNNFENRDKPSTSSDFIFYRKLEMEKRSWNPVETRFLSCTLEKKRENKGSRGESRYFKWPLSSSISWNEILLTKLKWVFNSYLKKSLSNIQCKDINSRRGYIIWANLSFRSFTCLWSCKAISRLLWPWVTF